MTGNTTSAEKLRSLFLAALMVFSVFAGTVALSGSAAAASGNVSLQSATPSSVLQGETVNNQNLTFSADFAPQDGNTDTVLVELDNADVVDSSLSPNSANANSTSISSSIKLVDGPDGDNIKDTLKFGLSDAGGPTTFSVDFGLTYADGTSALSGEVYVNDSNGANLTTAFPSLVTVGGDSSVSGFSGASNPLPDPPVTDNTPSASTTAGATQVIGDVTFAGAGNVTNVTVNATAGGGGDVAPSAISSVTVELYNTTSGDLLESNASSYDSHNTTVVVNKTNVTTGVDRIRVTADLSSAAAGSIDAVLYVQTNPTGTINTAGIQSVAGQTGFISGRVSDQANNDVPNATVLVENASLGFSKTTTTNSQGEYTIEVPEGTYSVTADKAGFATAQPKDTTVQENATTTANFVLRKVFFPKDIDVRPSSDTEFVGNNITYTVTVTDQNGSVLSGATVDAVDNNPDITFVSSQTKTTDTNGEATFTVTSPVIATGQLTFEAINASGPNPNTTATARFIPRSGNGTVIGNVFDVSEDDDHGIENATVYAVEQSRFLSNSIAVPTPNNASESWFYRVINNDTGEIVDYDDYRVDNNGANAAYQWAVIREHNTTNESFGNGFVVNTKVNNAPDVFVTPLEAGNYTVEYSTNQRNASDQRFVNDTQNTTNFTQIVPAIANNSVSVFSNLTDQNAANLSSLSGAKLIDVTDPDGKYVLDYLFADGQEGVEYVLVAEKAGYERDYVTATVTADGALFEDGDDENFDLRPRDVEADAVNITQVGLHPVSSYNTSKIVEFSNQTDEFAQEVPRNGSVIDVVEIETLDDEGNRFNGTAEVSIEDDAAFDGSWLNNSVIGGTVVSYAPNVDQITVNTGDDGVARLLLLADSNSLDLVTNKTAVLTNNRAASDNSTVRFVGQINFKGAAISGIVTDTNDDPVQDSVAYAERFTFPTDASVADPANFTAPDNQTRFTIEPTGGLAAAAIDDGSDTFIVTRQRWNTTGNFWEDANSATATRSELTNYKFPRSDFPGVSINLTSSSGFKLVDTVELGGGTDPDASYTLDPIPTVESATDAASTEYRVRAIKLSAPNASATRFGQAAVQPGSTDDANIVLPINVTAADLQITNLDAPTSASLGSTITVTADITNTGGAIGQEQIVSFGIDTDGDGTISSSEALANTTVDIAPGNTDTATFNIPTGSLSAGTYTHGVSTNDDSETATISLLGGAVFDITSTSVPDNVTQGDTLNVSAEVTNTGDVNATKSVSFNLNGTNVTAGGSGKVDIVFTFDDTGSMGDEIDGLQDNIVNFTNAVEASGADARYALVSFNDTVGVDQDYTDDVSTLQAAVNDLSAFGGGSFAENGYGAIQTAADLDHRSDASVVIVHITDASSHYEGDGSFESFSPEVDESALANQINSAGYSVVTVATESPTSDARANTTRWTIEDIADGEWVDIRSDDFGDLLEGRVADLVTSKASGTSLTLSAGESGTVTFTLSTDSLAPGTYTAEFTTEDDTATESVDVTTSGDLCPSLSSFVEGYDADDDCAISLTELGQASADFANGDITLTELGEVSTAFANTADT